MKYPHTLTITRETDGHYDSNDNWVPGSNETIFNGKCDFQDAEASEISSDSGDLQVKTVDGVIFLKDESGVVDVKIGDTGQVTVMQTNMDIVVRAKRFIDGVLEVDYQ